jgi:hypothetical protein
MSELIDKVRLPKEILEIVEKTNEPMSLDEIVEKFDPPFPFQARRVTDMFTGHIFTITGLVKREKGDIIKCLNCPMEWRDGDGVAVYESEECTHCLGLHDSSSAWYRHTKSWVLV